MAKSTINLPSKRARQQHIKSAFNRRSKNSEGRKLVNSTERKTIEQLAAEQGVKLEGQLERILGAGADLWSSDKEFEEFVQEIYDSRKESLRLEKR